MSASDDGVLVQVSTLHRFRNVFVLPSSGVNGGKVPTGLGSFAGASLNLGSD